MRSAECPPDGAYRTMESLVNEIRQLCDHESQNGELAFNIAEVGKLCIRNRIWCSFRWIALAVLDGDIWIWNSLGDCSSCNLGQSNEAGLLR